MGVFTTYKSDITLEIYIYIFHKKINCHYCHPQHLPTRLHNMCTMCNAAEETVFHIVTECRVHHDQSTRQTMGKHDKLVKVIHWDSCKKHGVEVQSKWYDHVPEKLEETDHVKIRRDFNIQTDHVTGHRMMDVVVLDKHEKMCQLIHIQTSSNQESRNFRPRPNQMLTHRNMHAQIVRDQEKTSSKPESRYYRARINDSRVASKEKQKYQHLARELLKLWQVKVKVFPVVVGALCTILTALEKHLKEIGTSDSVVELLQKAALLGTAMILRKTLEI